MYRNNDMKVCICPDVCRISVWDVILKAVPFKLRTVGGRNMYTVQFSYQSQIHRATCISLFTYLLNCPNLSTTMSTKICSFRTLVKHTLIGWLPGDDNPNSTDWLSVPNPRLQIIVFCFNC